MSWVLCSSAWTAQSDPGPPATSRVTQLRSTVTSALDRSNDPSWYAWTALASFPQLTGIDVAPEIRAPTMTPSRIPARAVATDPRTPAKITATPAPIRSRGHHWPALAQELLVDVALLDEQDDDPGGDERGAPEDGAA